MAERPTPTERPVAAMDVGGTSIKTGLVWPDLTISRVESVPIDAHAADVLEQVCAPLAATLDGDPRVTRAAVAFPAPFDYRAGTPLLRQKYAALHGLDLGAAIRRTLGRPDLDIRFLNDAQAAAVGESRAGAGRSHRRVLTITLGTGLGAAFTREGQIVAEVAGIEIGDLYTRPVRDGAADATADEVFSATGLCRLLSSDPPALPAAVTDPANRDRVRDWAVRLAGFCSPLLAAIGADVLVVGGGAGPALDVVGHEFTASLAVPWRPAELGPQAALIGAAVGTAA